MVFFSTPIKPLPIIGLKPFITKIKKTVLKPSFNSVNSILEVPTYKAVFVDIINIIGFYQKNEYQIND
jgi:hypothetical protein